MSNNKFIMSGSNSQACQDLFVLSVLNNKKNGYFLEIGSNEPVSINNTYLLETQYDWKGVMVEYNSMYKPLYVEKRPKSIHVIQDATTVDYLEHLAPFPKDMDYLQIDLEVDNRSTLSTLELLEKTVFDTYRFATVTFEHDIYRGDYFNTRERSREIFQKRGYVLMFPDVKLSSCSFEDWYVHPELVDMERLLPLRQTEPMESSYIINHLTNNNIST
jgi:hypothetical protein